MLPTWYNKYKQKIDDAIMFYLEEYLRKNDLSIPLKKLKEASIYACRWGKRLRGILTLEFYIIFSKKDIEEIDYDSDIMRFAVSLEMVHAYSLVHDDMPIMDYDTHRRWEITTRKKYGEYTALLVWDLLNTLSLELLSDMHDKVLATDIIKLLSYSIWFHGMVGWQMEDLEYERNENKISLEDLKNLHLKKTWALIRASILGWAMIWWEIKENLRDVEELAKVKWLAFQVKDDLLDVNWTFESTGKSVWWEKKWFVNLIWIEDSEKYLDNLINEAKTLIKKYENEKIEFIVDYIHNRTK